MHINSKVRQAIKSVLWLHDSNLRDLSHEATEEHLDKIYKDLQGLDVEEGAFICELERDLHAITNSERSLQETESLLYDVEEEIRSGFYLRALHLMRVAPYFGSASNHLRRAMCYEKLGCPEVALRFRQHHEAMLTQRPPSDKN
jgi:hypothetical protein